MGIRNRRLSLLLAAALLIPAGVRAQEDTGPTGEEEAPPMAPGGFTAVRDGVKVGAFTLEHTEVKAEISGGFARVEVSQRYANPGKERVEAIYTFPLPENAAVTDMFMRISTRVIVGEIHGREDAKRIYETAKSSGQTAALLEQERTNIFTQSLANIPPGEKIFVHIKYVHEVHYDAGKYRFVFPMTVGPRFTEGAPDASRIAPPPLLPGERSGHDIEVSVKVSPGLPITNLHSVSHQLVVERPAPDQANVSLAPSDGIPNKDFVLEWGLKAAKPEIALLSHREKDDGYLMMLVAPQPRVAPADAASKEMVFVIDTSGSQSGEPLAKEKQLVRRALQSMNPRDTFRLIRFDNHPAAYSPDALSGSTDNIRTALSWVNGLNAGGGTRLNAAMTEALETPRDPARRRFVFFLTDGLIGREDEVIAEIQDNLGDGRVFTFGVGSSVNRALLESMAKAGRGFAQYVRNDEDGAKVVELFYRRVRNPLLLDLKVDWGGLPVTDVEPAVLPDLFDAQPVYVFARYSGASTGTVTVTGHFSGHTYERKLAVRLPAKREANASLAPVWARRRVERLMDEQAHGEKPELVAQVRELGLKYRLMTKYTSFVAVEREIRADVNIPLQTVLIPVEMPEGVSYEGVFGRGAAVSIPRLKPGDPVLTVDAPPGTAAVIADFPFGPRRLCSYDAGRERWACRFLVPRSVADGVYDIRITCIGEDGKRTEMTARYTVDSKAPVLEIAARRVGGEVELVARPKAFVLETKGGRGGSATVTHDVKRLRARAPDGTLVVFKLEKRPGEFVWTAKVKGRGAVDVEAVDFAGNISLQQVALP
jgi:Ca-activated chloride channel family protein